MRKSPAFPLTFALPFAPTLLCLAATAAFAQDAAAPAPTAESVVAVLRDARTAAQRDAAVAAGIAAVKAGAVDANSLAAALAAPRKYAEGLPTGWVRKTIRAPDGKERPYLLHVPAKYDPAKAYRFVLEMHGGVSRPKHLTHEELEQGAGVWSETAERNEWFLAVPAGEQGCVWWDNIGSGMVLDIVRETRHDYHVDADATFASGFSDGGSGTWFLAAAHPTPFAGFVPLSGHASVAGMGGLQIHLRNYLNKPVWAANTDLDGLYPSAGLKPVFDALATLGAPTVWRDVKGFGHDPRYLATEETAILEWMSKVRRDTAPKSLTWEGAAGAPSRIDWLRVTKVTGGSGVAPFPDVNPALSDTRIRIGVQVDQQFVGEGVSVSDTVDGSIAKEMKIAAGDVVVGIDDKPVKSFADLRRALAAKKPGDGIVVKWLRYGAAMEAKATLPAAQSEPAFGRTKPFGTIRAEVKDNTFTVTSAGIGSFELLLSPRIVDMTKPVTVTVNGAQTFSGVVAPDASFMLSQAAQDEDPSLVYHAKLPIDVPAAPK